MIKKQRGVTLIELMVSMMLGLALVAGISQLFIQSQKSFRLQQNLSDMTDDGSFILEALAKGVLLAGFADKPSPALFTVNVNVMPTTGVPTISLAAGEFIHGMDTQLVYRYQLGDSSYAVNSVSELDNFVGTSSLTGKKNNPNAIPAVKGDIVTVRIYKKNDSNGIPVFYSKSETESDTGNDAQPLISEVEKLVFKYGIRVKCYEYVKNECTKIGDQSHYNPINDTFFYTTASNVDVIDPVTTQNNWQNVFAVKVFLVMRSADDKLTRNKSSYEIDGVKYTATDNRLYKVFSKTIYLRAPTQ